MDDDDAHRRNIKPIGKRAYALAGAVHERLWFGKRIFVMLGYERLRLLCIFRVGHLVDNQKPCVVSRVFKLRTRIAKSDNKPSVRMAFRRWSGFRWAFRQTRMFREDGFPKIGHRMDEERPCADLSPGGRTSAVERRFV